MPHFLLVDFGTTSTKSALLDLDGGALSHLRRHAALPARREPPGRCEVSLTAIRQRFEQLCRDAWDAVGGDLEGIVLCSEMHGFALLPAGGGEPLTPYVSWLDARALEAVDGTTTFDAVCRHLGDDFRRCTGMRARPGFPLINIVHCARTLDLPAEAVAVSLPGWLAHGGDDGPPPEHPTMLAGMALYDPARRRVAPQLLAAVSDLGGLCLRTGAPAGDDTVSGHWQSPAGPVPLFAGVGDHQCSVLGAGVLDATTASVNLGTGSQVAVVGQPAGDDVEHRPYFDGQDLSAVTHIPAGRALNEFVGFLQQAVDLVDTDTRPDMWQRLAAIGARDVAASTLDVDLAVFEGARGFAGGGGVRGILEGRLTPDHYLASVLRAFAGQYAEVLDGFGATPECVALGGGIARNLPQLAEVLAAASGRRVQPASAVDESLLGLRALALRCAGRAPTVADAWRRFGAAVQVTDD